MPEREVISSVMSLITPMAPLSLPPTNVSTPGTPFPPDNASAVLRIVNFTSADERPAFFTGALEGWDVHAEAVEVLSRNHQAGYFRLDEDTRHITLVLPPTVGRALALVDDGGSGLQFVMEGSSQPFEVPQSSPWLPVLQDAVAHARHLALFWHPAEQRIVHVRVVEARIRQRIDTPPPSEAALIASLVPADADRVDALIQEWRDQRCRLPRCSRVCLPFRFVARFCPAKASWVCRSLRQAGIDALKIWAYPAFGDFLVADTPNSISCDTVWDYHAAVLVRTTQRGVRVIDPTLFPCGSVTQTEWKNALKGRRRTFVTEADVYDRKRDGTRFREDPGQTDDEIVDARSALQTQMRDTKGPPYDRCDPDLC